MKNGYYKSYWRNGVELYAYVYVKNNEYSYYGLLRQDTFYRCWSDIKSIDQESGNWVKNGVPVNDKYLKLNGIALYGR